MTTALLVNLGSDDGCLKQTSFKLVLRSHKECERQLEEIRGRYLNAGPVGAVPVGSRCAFRLFKCLS